MNAAAPKAVKLHRQSKVLELCWADQTHHLPAELLRVYSPSAEVRGHGAGERILQTGKKYVALTNVEPVGRYALRLIFDDGHDSGLYTWGFLRELGEKQTRFWEDYERELKLANASRLPAVALKSWSPEG
ncbi:MAG: hypothetical protein RLZZ174_956 [Pseudomonadota bacterium]|jgi:DUF971 family protein|nr:DUF971 domain-containing protein [Pseudomonadota bacterium]